MAKLQIKFGADDSEAKMEQHHIELLKHVETLEEHDLELLKDVASQLATGGEGKYQKAIDEINEVIGDLQEEEKEVEEVEKGEEEELAAMGGKPESKSPKGGYEAEMSKALGM